jgi:sugar lactone lactonase YvrE
MRIIAALVAALALTAPAAGTDVITLVAGGGTRSSPAPAGEFKFIGPFGIDFAPDGAAWIVELEGGRLHRMTRDGTVTTLGGKLETKGDAGDGGPLAGAVFNGLHALAIHPGGEVYLADTWNARIRKIDPKTMTITTVAGVPGKKGFTADGPAAATPVNDIYACAFDPAFKKLYLADLPDRRILALDLAAGRVELVAGNGKKGTPTDGSPAKDSPLVDARAVAVDRQGNVYILERGGNALRVVDPQGRVRTVVNASGKKGADGDGGPALAATMNGPKHLCIDRDDTVIIADAENHLIRRYDPKTGLIHRVAGTGRKGTAGVGGDPLQCELNRPHGVTIGPDGALFIVDSYNHRLLKIGK